MPKKLRRKVDRRDRFVAADSAEVDWTTVLRGLLLLGPADVLSGTWVSSAGEEEEGAALRLE